MNSTRIVHITNNDYDGAGRAVMRVHKELVGSGVDSIVIVLYKTQTNENVISLTGEISPKDLKREQYSKCLKIFNRIKRYKFIIIKLLILKVLNKVLNVDINFFLFNFNYPLVGYKQVLSHLSKNDIIFLYSIQEMIAPEFLPLLHQKSNHPLIFRPLDMEQMTGGCHFNYDCLGYMQSCTNCPQINFSNIIQLSRNNMTRKEKAYSSIDYKIIASNTYVKSILEESYLFSKQNIEVIYLGIESDRYRNISKNVARKELNLPINDKIIIFGCFDLGNPRKGYSILKKALIKTANEFNYAESNLNSLVHLVTFGDLGVFTFNDVEIKWTHLGRISSSLKMNLIYRAADILVSPSIDELGPTVIVESFLNELPVVSFEIGIAKDLITNGLNGYLVPCFEEDKYTNAIISSLTKGFKINSKYSDIIQQYREKCTVEYEANAVKNYIGKLI